VNGFDVNLSILFPGMPLSERLAAAARAGFDAVEMWWPFAQDLPPDAEVEDLVETISASGLALVAMNMTTGNAAAGEHGLVSLPGERLRFRDNLDVAVAVAERLGTRIIHAPFGNTPTDAPRDAVRAVTIENLATAAERAARIGAGIVVEPLNPYDFPRFGLQRVEDALEILDLVKSETGAVIGLLFDVYHIQRSEGDLIARIRAYADRFGHVQVADAPDRLHPGTGEVAFERVLPALEQAGYQGYVGLEYRPSADPDETFAWLPADRRRSGPAV
jgi:hydroxypyruvate isomerase